MLPEADEAEASAWAERVRAAVAPNKLALDDGRLLGIVSERELIASTLQHDPREHFVRDVMQTDFIAYEEDTPAKQILESEPCSG